MLQLIDIPFEMRTLFTFDHWLSCWCSFLLNLPFILWNKEILRRTCFFQNLSCYLPIEKEVFGKKNNIFAWIFKIIDNFMKLVDLLLLWHARFKQESLVSFLFWNATKTVFFGSFTHYLNEFCLFIWTDFSVSKNCSKNQKRQYAIPNSIAAARCNYELGKSRQNLKKKKEESIWKET